MTENQSANEVLDDLFFLEELIFVNLVRLPGGRAEGSG
jgi:hypothetical protein